MFKTRVALSQHKTHTHTHILYTNMCPLVCALKAHDTKKVRPLFCYTHHTEFGRKTGQLSVTVEAVWMQELSCQIEHYLNFCMTRKCFKKIQRFCLSWMILNRRFYVYSSRSLSRKILSTYCNPDSTSQQPCVSRLTEQCWCHSRPIGKTDHGAMSFNLLFIVSLCWQLDHIRGTLFLCSALLCTVSHFGSKHLLVRRQYLGGFGSFGAVLWVLTAIISTWLSTFPWGGRKRGRG